MRDGERGVGAQRVLRSEQIDIHLADQVVLALSHPTDILWPVGAAADLHVLDFRNDLLISPLANEFVYPRVALQQRPLPHACSQARFIGEVAVVVPNLEQVLQDQGPLREQWHR